MNRQLSTNSQVFYVFVDCMSIIFVTNDFTDKKLILTKCSLNKIVHELFKFEMYKPGVYSLARFNEIAYDIHILQSDVSWNLLFLL